MCRIFGLVDPGLTRDELRGRGELLTRLLHHGGPDDQAYRINDGVLVGGTRLAISDPARGAQPFTGDGVTVFYNGEIYNADDLRRRLRGVGVGFRTGCDGEVLAPLFARYGLRAAELLDGMFAVAVHDERTGALTLVRDPSGIKPLYLFADGARFGFASEIPALLHLRGRGAHLDLDALDRYLRFKAVYGSAPDPDAPGDPTLVRGVHALPPGHALQLTPGGGGPDLLRVGAAGPAVVADPVGELGDLLPRLVSEMLPADRPYCAVLSGGLDSTVVTTLAARAAGPLTAFTVVPRRPSAYDESPFAERVAADLGACLERVPVGGRDVPALLPAVVRHLGQPNSDPITVSTYRLFREIRAAGFPVALTGDGSDEVFGGYDRFRTVAGTGDVTGYRSALAAVPSRWRDALYSDATRRLLRRRRRPDAGPSEAADPAAVTDEVTDFELRHRLPVYHLQRVDHLSAAHAVEARVPFCRPDVVRLGRGLRLTDKIGTGGGEVKVTLSAAARRFGWAPEEVLRRPKQPFTFRLSDTLLEDGGLALEWAKEVLTDPAAQRGYFDAAQVEKLIAQFEEHRSESLAHGVWALLVLELWQREITGI